MASFPNSWRAIGLFWALWVAVVAWNGQMIKSIPKYSQWIGRFNDWR